MFDPSARVIAVQVLDPKFHVNARMLSPMSKDSPSKMLLLYFHLSCSLVSKTDFILVNINQLLLKEAKAGTAKPSKARQRPDKI